MLLSLLIASVVGVALGAAIGHVRFRRSACGAMVGALAGPMLCMLIMQSPSGVMAVEDPGQFESDVLDAHQPVVVDFFADWCPPCRRLQPTIELLSQEYLGRIRFVKIDVDRSPEMANSYQIKSIPTVMVFAGGKVVHKWTGNRPIEHYQGALDELLAPK